MHKVKTQRSGKLFGKNMLIFNFFYLVIIKNYNVKTIFNKFPDISGKIGINFRKFSNSPPYSQTFHTLPKYVSKVKVNVNVNWYSDLS